MTSDQNIHKELDLIQDVIKRMAKNSFQVKTWLMAVLTAIIAFTSDELFGINGEASITLAFMLYLPIVFFWYLDAFFLKTEQLYRNVYKWVVQYRSMTSDYLYDLNTFNRQVEGKPTPIKIPSLWKVMTSQTIFFFYFIPFLFVTALLVYKFVS